MPWTEKGMLFPEKHKFRHPFGIQYLDPTCESPGNARKSSLSKSSEEDEIVNHMSNLPPFLQQEKKENSIQANALNFGILDWKRLEKWKYDIRMHGTHHKRTSSSISDAPDQNPKSPSSLHGPNPCTRFSSLLNSSKEEKCTEFGDIKYIRKESGEQEHLLKKVKFYERSRSERKCPRKELLSVNEASSSECGIESSLSTESLQGPSSMVDEETRRHSFSFEASDKMQEKIEQPGLRGRPHSPSRRLGFNLGKLGRSFSFRESSAGPQLSSSHNTVKSNPVRPEVSSETGSRERPNPLRKLLDPLIKHKGARFAKTLRPLNGSLDLVGPSQDEKPNASAFKGLLQLKLKNGLPFFKLVVHNKDMLAATVKTSGKGDSGMIFVFSVHEIRKSSINKSKSCNLGYDIVGQMRISASYHQKLNRQGSGLREYVLYSVGPGKTDEQKPDVSPNREIAAIIVKNSSDNLDFGDLSDRNSDGVVVILPGGLHGTPINGAPSSLISRWRSGGSCDCGGWDVGCKLQIFTDYKNSSKILDHPDLFLQDGKSKPVFRLEPFSNGFYSVESDGSISLLEAFATCVAYITCQKFCDIFDAKELSVAEHFQKTIIGSDQDEDGCNIAWAPRKVCRVPTLVPIGKDLRAAARDQHLDITFSEVIFEYGCNLVKR